MANLKDVIYISNEDYSTLVSTGTVTIDGETLTYDENNVYITPDKLASSTEDGLMSAVDKSKLDGLDDSNLVHKTGNETITGTKSFTGGINLSKNNLTYGSISVSSDNKFTISSGTDIVLSGQTLTLGSTSSKNLKIVNSSTGSTSSFTFTDKYTAPGTTTTITATYGFQTNKSSNGSYTIATTDDIPEIIDLRSQS